MTRFPAPFASGGDEFLKVFSYILTRMNADGGALGKKFEIVPFDDKRQPAEALIALKNVTGQKNPLCYAMQRIERWCRAGSMVFPSINARNPDNRILYLNCGELATERTNEKCDSWHFRFSDNVEMRRRVSQGAAERCHQSLSSEPGLPVWPVGIA